MLSGHPPPPASATTCASATNALPCCSVRSACCCLCLTATRPSFRALIGVGRHLRGLPPSPLPCRPFRFLAEDGGGFGFGLAINEN